jgi:regulatory protein
MSYLAHSDMSFQTYVKPPMANNDNVKAIKATALRYLARREYSRLELFRKLSQKYASGDTIQNVLTQLKEQGYQSDDRFTEMFIRSKVRAGNGPFKIKIELREKGICESTVLSAFDKQSIDWFAVAEQVKNKRFGRAGVVVSTDDECHGHEYDNNEHDTNTYQSDMNLLAKQVRYLKNKGFYQEHIEEVTKK